MIGQQTALRDAVVNLSRMQESNRELRATCSRLIIENDRLMKANIRVHREVDRITMEKIGIVQRHGAATFLLQKFTRRWCVRVFCRELRAQAEEHLNSK